jgi:hypothetical protein
MFRWRLLSGLVVLALFGFLVPIGAQDSKKKDDSKKEEKKKDEPKKEDTKKDGQGVLLKWKFEKDKPFYQKMVTTTEQTMKVMNNDVKQTQNQTFYFSWTPVKQDGDTWTIKQKIEGVAMKIDIGNQKIEFDSTAPKPAGAGNNPLSDFFTALVGSEFTLTLDTKDMKVTKVEGREAFLDKLVKANPQMKPLLEQILSEKALKEMAEPTFAAIPGKEEKKGDSWSKESSLDMGPIGKYENSYKYTFEGPDEKNKDIDKIKVETTLKYKEPGDVAGVGGLPFKIKSADLKSSNATGTIQFDHAKGLIQKSDMKLDLSGELNIEIGGQTTKVTLSQTQTSSVETSDKPQITKP